MFVVETMHLVRIHTYHQYISDHSYQTIFIAQTRLYLDMQYSNCGGWIGRAQASGVGDQEFNSQSEQSYGLYNWY